MIVVSQDLRAYGFDCTEMDVQGDMRFLVVEEEVGLLVRSNQCYPTDLALVVYARVLQR